MSTHHRQTIISSLDWYLSGRDICNDTTTTIGPQRHT
jgi:hypothetical protein